MKRAILILLVLVALVSGAEIGIMNENEYLKSLARAYLKIYSSMPIDQAPEIYTYIVSPFHEKSLGVVIIVSEGKEQSAICLHLVFAYILLTLTELVLIILAVTLLSISVYRMLRDRKKETKVNE